MVEGGLSVSVDPIVLDAHPAVEIDPTTRAAIWEALRAVPFEIRRRRREAVQLQREGLTKVEIAERMDISVRTLQRDRIVVVEIFRAHGLQPSVKSMSDS